MKNILTLFFVVIATFSLAGCAEPPASADHGKEEEGKVTLCYTGSNTSRAELASLALEQCPEGSSGVQVVDHATFFNDCPLSRKNSVVYQCVGQ